MMLSTVFIFPFPVHWYVIMSYTLKGVQIQKLREVTLVWESTTLFVSLFAVEFEGYKLNAVAESICVMFDAPMAYGSVTLCLIEKWGKLT